MLNVSKNLIKDFNNSCIRWVVWKGIYHYEDGFNGVGDADIFVLEEDRAKIEKVFKDNGLLQFTSSRIFITKGIEDWLGFDKETGKLIHIHLHYQMRYGKPYVNEYKVNLSNLVFEYAVETKEGVSLQGSAVDYMISLHRIINKCATTKKTDEMMNYYKHVLSLSSIDEEAFDKISITVKERQLLLDYISQQSSGKEVSKVLNNVIKKVVLFPLIISKIKQMTIVFFAVYNRLLLRHYT